jgi:mannose-6-phosphate isomerase-like protein (cupin superfamily)
VTDFSRDNFEDIEEAGGAVEARFTRSLLGFEQIGISHFRYPPNFRAGFGHRHETQEEGYVVVGGSGRMKIGDEVIELRKWDVIRVAPQAARAFEGGPEGLELIAVGGARPPEGDGHKVDDFWP